MPKVFVIHQPAVRDHFTSNMRPQHDLSPALRYGQIIDVLPPGSITQDTNVLTSQIEKRFKEENFSEGDFIIAMGDPIAIVAGALVAARMSATVRLLKWDRRMQGYLPCEINVKK